MPKEVYIARRGGPEVFAEREIEQQAPGPGEVAIDVAAAGVNFADLMGRMGFYPEAPPIPFSPGFEVAGTVAAVGEGVSHLTPGEGVIAVTRFGGYAETVTTGAAMAFPLPAGVSFAEAAGFPVIYATADLAMNRVGALRDGERVLIHGGAGGVGTAAVRLAKRRDVTVLASAGTREKADFLEREGVDLAIPYRERDVAEAVREFTDGKGVHVILDPRGGAGLKEDFTLLAPMGRIVAYGVSVLAPGKKRNILKALWALRKFPKIKATSLMMNNQGILGLNLLHLFGDESVAKGFSEELLPLFTSGELRPVLHNTHPLTAAGAAEAHRELHDRENIGKVVLVRS